MSYKTDLGRVLGLGSAKSGAEHWLGERIKALALIPLTIGFLCIIVPAVGLDYAEFTARIAKPLNSFILILFFLVTFKHLEEGLQVVFEDYVHKKGAVITLLVLNKLGCWTLGLGAVFAVAKLAFSA